jgi:hypothetical protein
MTSLHALILSIAALAAGVVLRAIGDETLAALMLTAGAGGLAGAWGMERHAKKAESKKAEKAEKALDSERETTQVLTRKRLELEQQIREREQARD